jgi:putative peptidoglycan lipid II flippase
VLRSVGLLFGGNVLSKAVGLLREFLLAYFYGTSPVADAYRGALSAVLIPTHLVTGGAVQSGLVPLLAKTGAGRGLILLRAVGACMLVAGVVVVVVAMVWSGVLVRVVTPGFGEETAALAATMLKVFAIAVPLYLATAALAMVGMAQRDFRIPAIRPVLQNAGLLLAIPVAVALDAPVLLAAGFAAAYLVLTMLGVRFARSYPLLQGASLRPRAADFRDRIVGTFAGAAGPLAGVALVTQGGVLVDRAVSSLVGPGGVASVDYARFLAETPVLLLGTPLALAALGHFSDDAGWAEHQAKIRRTVAGLLLLTLPLSALMVVAGPEIVTVIFRRGRFDQLSVAGTAAALQGMAFGVWGWVTVYFLQRVFSARLRNREVFALATVSVAIGAALNLALYRPLGLFGVGLASGAAQASYCLMLAHRMGMTGLFRDLAAPAAFGVAGTWAGTALLVEFPALLGLLAKVLVVAAAWTVAFLAAGTTRSLLLEAAVGLRDKIGTHFRGRAP